MTTVVLGEPPAELAALIERRRLLSLDLYDELWEGMHHMVPAPRPAHGYVDRALAVLLAPYAAAASLVGTGPFNLGTPEDYRVPDGGYHRSLPSEVYVPTAAVVVEILSPDDETFGKFDFYARHGVDELLVGDATTRRVRCWERAQSGGYTETSRSKLLGIATADLIAGIDWPADVRPV